MRKNLFFIKIVSGFLLLFLITAAAFSGVLFSNAKEAKTAAVKSLNSEFRAGAESVSRMFSQIKYTMAELSVKFAANDEFDNGAYIDNNTARADMRALFIDRRQNEFSRYVSTIFIVDTLKDEYIYELTGTYTADVFYSQLFANETYGKEFWETRTYHGESFEVFSALPYKTVRDDMKLLPITYKPKDVSRYLVVMLLDIEAITEEYGISIITQNNAKVLYLSEKASELSDVGEIIHTGTFKGGEVFKYTDEKNDGIEFFDIVLNTEIDSVKYEVSDFARIFSKVLILLALLFFVFFGGGVLRFFQKLEKELLSNSSVKAKFKDGITSEGELFDAVKMMSLQNATLLMNTSSGESVLDSMLLQAHMRDVYVGVNDIETKFNNENPFFVIYFKVSYLKGLKKYIGDDEGKATFLLKQLIELYLESWGFSAVTFQTDKQGIVSVFDASKNIFSPEEVLEKILIKLSNESEYAYFTVALSNIHEGTDNIKEVFENMIDISKYGKLVMETQILREDEVRGGARRFYFSVEEMGKLSAIIQNGTEEEICRKVDEILEFNIRKDINRFEMYLLCTEIVNCAIKLINRVFSAIPNTIDISVVHKDLEAAEEAQEYREVCLDFLHEVTQCIKQNKSEDDYIISYILDYIENHYSEDIYLNLFAEKLKLTGAYISSYFKEKMNVNLTDYINNYRIKKAVELTENPQKKNKDIAESVGLPNINTFIRLFKKYTGYTPGEYRKKHFGEAEKK